MADEEDVNENAKKPQSRPRLLAGRASCSQVYSRDAQ